MFVPHMRGDEPIYRKGKISEEGFTLLEVMIALMILSVGILGFMKLQIASIQGNAFGIEMTQATITGQEKMEELKNMAYGAMTGGNDTVTRAGVPFARSWTVTPSGTISTIEVVVGWTDKAGTGRSVTLATLRANL